MTLTVQEMSDRFEIQDLIVSYCYAVDNKEFDKLDDVFTLPSQRNAALSTLERDLALLGPGDRMAIVAYDGHGLTVLSKWTADTQALHAAFHLDHRDQSQQRGWGGGCGRPE